MTEDERYEMLDWIYSNIDIFSEIGNNRLEKRLGPDVHPLFHRIRERLVRRELLRRYEQEPRYKDFVALILPGGGIQPHRDPNAGDLVHCRFNVILEMPSDGFNVYYDGHPIEAVEGHYVLCRSGQQVHWSDVNSGDDQRISISYGFLLPQIKVDALKKDFPFDMESYERWAYATLGYYASMMSLTLTT